MMRTSKLILERFVVGPFQVNAWLVGCAQTRQGAVIDPGGGAAQIASRAGILDLQIGWIILTHGHGDHIGGVGQMKNSFPAARVAVHSADAAYLTDARKNLSAQFGLPVVCPAADTLLEEGREIAIGRLTFRIIHVPGHTPGGICLYSPAVEGGADAPVLFSGDVLFQRSIGRSDFPGGNQPALIRGIREKLLILPPDTIVYPGHGEPTTIGEETAENPFL